MRWWKPSLATILLAVPLAACGEGASETPSVQPAAFGNPACPTAGNPGPARGAVPDGFVTAWVLRCSVRILNVHDGAETPSVAERADTPAEELVAALRRPSDPRWHGFCSTELVTSPYFMLVDANGRAVAPAIPADGCGKPHHDVLTALDMLPFRKL